MLSVSNIIKPVKSSYCAPSDDVMDVLFVHCQFLLLENQMGNSQSGHETTSEIGHETTSEIGHVHPLCTCSTVILNYHAIFRNSHGVCLTN